MVFRALFHRIAELDPRTRKDLVTEIEENLQSPSHELSNDSHNESEENLNIQFEATKQALETSQQQYEKMVQLAQFLSMREKSYRELLDKREEGIQAKIIQLQADSKTLGIRKDEEACNLNVCTNDEQIQALQTQQEKDMALLDSVNENYSSIRQNIAILGRKIEGLQNTMKDIVQKRNELEEFVMEARKVQEEEDIKIQEMLSQRENHGLNSGDIELK